ncbi:MAG: HAMP domain-containing histidine kinase [Candidatus Niyogibacteria bacterium]|nr:HAMP domain-containing histidine kinase [Candidatus Niyogibacteria bacterium]
MDIFLILVLSFILLLFVESFFWWRKVLSRGRAGNKKMMQEFISLLVHDMRGPLDNIQKISELMLSPRHQLDDVQRKEYTNLIHESSSSMLVLMNTISDAAKLGLGRLNITKTENDLLQLIEERKSFFALSITQAHVSFTSSFHKDVPQPLLFDRRVVSDALNNLISNAIKFNRPDGWVRIDVFLMRKGEKIEGEASRAGVSLFPPAYQEGRGVLKDTAVIAISHSDSGIPAETLPQIFRQDEQVDENFLQKIKRAHGSSLFITKNVILQAGGTIGAGSKESEGTTFFFTIPIEK